MISRFSFRNFSKIIAISIKLEIGVKFINDFLLIDEHIFDFYNIISFKSNLIDVTINEKIKNIPIEQSKLL